MQENLNAYVINYKKDHYKQVPIELPLEYYNAVVEPTAKAEGKAVSTYIKEAIKEKIERESK